ncbi:GNAT family N-acetyltransferase [Streptomyces sp. NPDC046994]|uniref:GNAT family N-acetyltransferase n=1 Tax=Streptomyces sp. NPDC046994 TaxID=3155735 RepID=UPI0034559624
MRRRRCAVPCTLRSRHAPRRDRPTETYLARIEIHLDHQNLGIGSRLARGLLYQARRQHRGLTLDVRVINQRARALDRPTGLHEATHHGKNNIKIRMSIKPPRPCPIHRS